MPNRTPRILYIDDDRGLSRLVEKNLSRRGYAVELAGDAADGVARLKAGGIDVVAVDHYLPTGTGIDVVEAVKELPSPPPVVYVTASAESAVAVAALKAGAFDYVVKSVDADFLELLANAIDQAAERARLLRLKERAEADLLQAKERAELLLREVNHRVANSLAMVASLVRMQANAVDEPAAKLALAETEARISAIANVHRSLYTSDDVRSVDLGEYLASVIGEIDRSIGADGAARLSLHLDRVLVPTDRAVYVGVIAAELVTNAMKYAYPPPRAGEVRVFLQEETSGRAQFSVEDDGVGWSGSGETKGTGLGTTIIRAMAMSLGSEVSYEARPAGTRATLEIPLA